MKKTFLLSLMVLILSLLTIGTITASAETNGYLTYKISNGEVMITHCDVRASGDFKIPNEIGGYPVTSIESSAFTYCSNINSITIPDNVKYIGSSAFSNCTALTSVFIGNGVTEIGMSAFSDLKNLTNVTLGNSVEKIGGYAFEDSNIVSINIPKSVKYIGFRAFDYCYKLTNVDIEDVGAFCNIEFRDTYANPLYYAEYLYLNGKLITDLVIPDNVTTIGDYAFYSLHGLTSVTIGDSATSIGAYAFNGCVDLTTINISDNVTTIGNYAFNNTGYYDNDDNWKNDVLYIDKHLIKAKNTISGDYIVNEDTLTISESAFVWCSGLTSITIPEGISSINKSSFSRCTGLSTITIPNSVTTIGDSAFYGCTGLSFITLPNGVTSIGDSAFYDCTGLTSINIPNSATSISAKAFYGCTGLTSIIIPNDVTTIGDSAFYGCTGLTSINIPNSATSISANAFYGCTELTSITIPNNIKTIGTSAFYNCTSLTNIKISDNIITICENAFYNTGYYNNDDNWENDVLYIDKHLIDAKDTISGECTVKEDTLTISQYAFHKCYNLTTINLGNGVISIGNNAFESCSSLRSITIPDNVTSLGNYAFKGCYGLNTAIIGNGVDKIGNSVFASCTKLSSINFSDNVTSIGNSAFRDCYGLTSITIPNSVITIGDSAFNNCNELTAVTIGNNVESIGSYAFYWCNDILSITIPDSVTSIGDNAFDECSKLETVYYNGTPEDWNKMLIGKYNEDFTSATRKYFYYITLFNKDKSEIISAKQNINECIDTSLVVVPEGYELVLYTDEDFTQKYDINTPIAENLTLYADFIKLNSLEFEGVTTADIGEQGITQKVYFATDKETKYFSCTLKVPNSITVQEIKSNIFEIEQDYEVIDNDTHYYLFLIYNDDGNIPTYQTLNAFEIVVDVSENAFADEMLTIEILDDAILADDDGNSYEFTSIGKAEIKINPILTEEITIVGADEIDVPTQYTVSVLPENATNQNVEWSVSDETIATISEDGLLTPVKKGNVTVRATAKDGSGVYAEKTVSVKVLGTVNSITTNIGIWDKEYSPDTTNYTIYVPESTTSIRLTAKHDGTFKTDKTTFVNNVTRPITLSTTSDETVLELTYTCEGYDDNQYTITIIKFEGTKTEVLEDKKSFTITPINVEIGKTVILALYNGEQFVEMQSAVYTGEAVPFTTTKSYTKAKVMVWEDLMNLTPICDVETIE